MAGRTPTPSSALPGGNGGDGAAASGAGGSEATKKALHEIRDQLREILTLLDRNDRKQV